MFSDPAQMHRETEPVTRFDKANRRTTLGAQTAKRDLKRNGLHFVDVMTRVDLKTFFSSGPKSLQGIATGPKGIAFRSGKVLVFVCHVLAYY